MKKTVTLALAALMSLALVGCSSSKDEGVDVAADAAADGTEWVDTVYEEEATEDVSEKIEDDKDEITKLEGIIQDFESETAYSAEDIEKLESNADEEIIELQSDIDILESEED